MTESTVARRYARALYEEAERAGSVEQIDDDMATIRATLESSKELEAFFQSPIISREKKEAVVASLFGERLASLTRSFIGLLIEKQREDLFPEVARAYGALRDEQQGVVEATARTAIALSEEEEQHLVQALERKTGQTVRLRVVQDPALLGGVVVRIGDTVYDGSVRHQLETLRERMEQGQLVTNGA